MRKENWKRLIASTSIIAMVTANMSSDLSAMRFVYADEAAVAEETSAEQTEEPAAEEPADEITENATEGSGAENQEQPSTEEKTAPATEMLNMEASVAATSASSAVATESATAAADASASVTAEQSNQIKVTYAAGEGGSVSRTEETADFSAAEVKFEGSVATAAEGYKFVNWTDTEENIVSESAEFIPSGITADTAYTANFELQTDSDKGMVTITYKASEGGSVTLDTEEVKPADPGTVLKGAEAKADEGYEFVKWTDADGREVSAEAVFVPVLKANDDGTYSDVVYIADFEKKISYPAQDFEGSAGDVTVRAHSDEGAFPENTRMELSEVTGSELEDVKDAAQDNMQEKVVDAVAVDITFYNQDGEKIEPESGKNVSVQMHSAAAVDGDNHEVVHVEENGAASAVAEAGATGASFKTDSFTIYAIIGTNAEYRATYNFRNADGTLLDTQIVKNNEKLTEPETPSNGKTTDRFLGWSLTKGSAKADYIIDYAEAVAVTGDSTIDLYAVYATVYHVYFYNSSSEDAVILSMVELESDDIYTITESLSGSVPTAADETCVGWSEVKNGTTDIGSVVSIDKNAPKDITLYPIISKVKWVYFDTDGGNYIAPVYVKGISGKITKPANPQKSGYNFSGWYTAKGTEGKKFDFKTAIAADTTIYAHWTPGSAKYTVIIWKQSLHQPGDDDSSADYRYDYGTSITHSGTTGETVYSYADLLSKYEGFELDKNRSDGGKIVEADGSTVLNVFYRRKVYKITFYTWKADNIKGGYSWQQQGNTLEGLYGSTFESYGYTWPTDYNWYEERKNDGEVDGIHTTYLTGFISIRQKQNYYGIKETATAYVYNYKQQLDGTYLVNADNMVGMNIRYVDTWEFTNKYDGFKVKQYSEDGKTYWNISAGDTISIYDNLYIRYERNRYVLDFHNGSDGTIKGATKNVLFEAPLSTYAGTPAPNRPAALTSEYEFTGWYKDEECTQKFDFSGTMPSNNLVVYAGWAKKIYTVTFNWNYDGANPKSVTRNVSSGNTVAQPDIPERTGYQFAGWTENDKPFNLTVQIHADHNLTAKWLSTAALKIAYNAGANGTFVLKDSASYKDGAAAKIIGAAKANSGYYFAGWKLNDVIYQSGETFQISSADAVENVVTLTAVYTKTPVKAVITYNPNGAAGKAYSEAYLNNSSVTLLDVTDSHLQYTNQGYSFGGWNTSADGKGRTYQPGNTVGLDTEGQPEANCVYAIWKQKEHTIYYKYKDIDGKTKTFETDMKAGCGNTVNVKVAIPTADGYTFSGWTTDDVSVSKGSFTMPDKDVNFSGFFTENGEIEIRYNASTGGTVSSQNEKLKPATGVAKGSEATALPGYHFVNWTDAEGKEVSETTKYIPLKINGLNVAASYTANFKEDSAVTIRYKAAPGGSVSLGEEELQPATGVAKGSTATALPGYHFVKWTDNSNKDVSTEVSFIPQKKNGVYSARVYTAHFTQNAGITIKYSADEGGTVDLKQEELAPATGTAKGSKATALPGYHFVNWTNSNGEVVGTEALFKPKKTAEGIYIADTYTAHFTENGKITITYIANTGGSVSSAGETLAPATGTATGSKAKAAPGYTFKSWTNAKGEVVGTSLEYVPEKSGNVYLEATYTANFTENAAVTINYLAVGGGKVSPASETLAPATGTAQGSKATPAAGYHFVNWTEGTEEVSRNIEFVPEKVNGLNVAATYTAHFAENADITINYETTTGGTVSRASENLAPVTGNAQGSVATPSAGYHFVNWTEEGKEAGRNADFVPEKVNGLNIAATYTAHFAENADITISYTAAPGGTVSRESEILAPATGNAQGSVATPATGYHFVNWTNAEGEEVGTIAAYVPVKADGLNVAASYTAHFAENADIVITYIATEGGTVSKGSETLAPVTGSAQGSTAAAANGYHFVNWTDADGKEVGTATLYVPKQVNGLNVEATYTAHFAEDSNVKITYIADAGGTVSRESENLAPVTGSVNGSQAKADDGYHFVNWTDADGKEVETAALYVPEKVNGLNVAATYTAHFAENAEIEINYEAMEGGTVSRANEVLKPVTGIAAGSIAKAKAGYHFVNWADEDNREVGTYATFIPEKEEGLNIPATYTANFEEDPKINIYYKAADGGTVDSDSEILAPATGKAIGSTAKAKAGYHFSNWMDSKGRTVGTEALFVPAKTTDEIYVTDTYTANFTENSKVTISYIAGEGGSVDYASETLAPATGIAAGSTAIISAGYSFLSWTDKNGRVVSNELKFVPEKVDGLNVEASYTANFTPRTDISYTVNYLESGTGNVLAPVKTVTGRTFNTLVTETAIAINGYSLNSALNVTITLGSGSNVINFYYSANTTGTTTTTTTTVVEVPVPAAATPVAAPAVLGVNRTPAVTPAATPVATTEQPTVLGVTRGRATGDESQDAMRMIVILICAGAAVSMIWGRRKKEENEK